jgi:hypothetical protein
MKEINEKLTKIESPYATLTTYDIKKVHPRLVTIQVRYNIKEPPITINLPITESVYTILLKNMAKPDFGEALPLVFYVNKKGVSYQVLPLETHQRLKQRQEQEKKDAETTK